MIVYWLITVCYYCWLMISIQCHWGRPWARRSCPSWSSRPSSWTRSPVWMPPGPVHRMLAPKAIWRWVGIRWKHLYIQWGLLDILEHSRCMNRCMATYVRTYIIIRALLTFHVLRTHVRTYPIRAKLGRFVLLTSSTAHVWGVGLSDLWHFLGAWFAWRIWQNLFFCSTSRVASA